MDIPIIFVTCHNFITACSWCPFGINIQELQLIFHWSLFVGVELTIFQALVQIKAWRRLGDKPLSEPMIIFFLAHVALGLNNPIVKEQIFEDGPVDKDNTTNQQAPASQ